MATPSVVAKSVLLQSIIWFEVQTVSSSPSQAAIDAIGTPPEKTVFVGDRVREDYEGPRAVGMRAIVVTAHAEDEPRDGVPTIASLGELTSLL